MTAETGDPVSVQFDFRILGPLEVIADGNRVAIGGPRQRTVLAMLLLTPNRVVSVDRLVEAVWGGQPPATYRTQIAICVASLRKAFQVEGHRDDVIVTAAPGYMLLAGEQQIDSVDFAARVESAQRLTQLRRTAEAADLLREALDLWRGAALADISSAVVEAEAALLEQQRLNAYEQYAALQVERGRHREIVSELGSLVRDQPLREHARATLMLAHYRSGRRSQALELFRQARQASIDELGLEPGKALQDLHGAILREDPALIPATMITNSLLVSAAGAQLPLDAATFVAREQELAALDALLDRPRQHGSAAIGFIAGRPGIGKAALAVHWAHRVAASFPDGQLFADVGEETGDDGERVSAVLARFLRAFGSGDEEIPVCPRERAALFHRFVDGRRMLIVLKDVQDTTRIKALIPRSSTCCVIITSRKVHSSPARVRLRLGPLQAREAVRLLDALVGDDRVREDRAAAEELVQLCDHLPLAVSAAAARLAAKPHWSVSRLADRLRDPMRRLDELSHGRPEIRATFDLSYGNLSPAAAIMYRRLGLLLGAPELEVWTGARLLNTDPLDAENLMEQLVDAALLEVGSLGPDGRFRYRLPSLLALHAQGRAEIDDHRQARRAVRLDDQVFVAHRR